MASDEARLLQAFTIARKISSKVNTSQFPIPLNGDDGLIKSVTRLMQDRHDVVGLYDIKVEMVNATSDIIYSRLSRYTNKAIIRYPRNLNVCWRRFAITKELCHVLIDVDEIHYTEDLISLIESLIFDKYTVLDDDKGSERLTMLMAVEVLLPWKLRNVIQSWENEGVNNTEIATRCRVPEVIVYQSANRAYQKLRSEINSILDEGAD